MEPTREDLRDAGCWFDSDKAGGAQMTAFKREARWRQHRWAVDELSITSFGSHAGRRTDPDVPAEDIPNGTKLKAGDADAGANFLTPSIEAIARARVAEGQMYQTLDETRLFRDLLSSMPMAFNLFGDASLPAAVAARARLAELFGVAGGGAEVSDIVFEWSPGRRDPGYTNDRTAFDVAIRLGDPNGPRTVIGIETKYHEHAAKEKTPSKSRRDALRRFEEQTEYLVALAEQSGVFKPRWQDRVLGTGLRQLWRDHLLALSMRRHPRLWTPQTRYVLVYPARNVSFRDAATAYGDLLVDSDDSFQAATLESVAEVAFAPGSETGQRFRRRYLW